MLRTSAEPSPVLPNQCGELGVELGCLADAEDEVLVAEDQPHSAGEHVEPFEAVVCAEHRGRLRRRDHDLPGLNTAGRRSAEARCGRSPAAA